MNHTQGTRQSTTAGRCPFGSYAAMPLLLLALALTTGCRPPSEAAAYQVACAALAADKTLPAGSVARPAAEARFYLSKSAGAVRLPYDFADASGRTATASYTVWLKRLARTWVLDRAFPTPDYTAPAPEGGS